MVEHIRGDDLVSLDAGAQDTGAILVAQADVPVAAVEPARLVIAVEDGSILRLPATASIDEPRVNGADLEFVQPDGSVIVVPQGAVQGLTIFIGPVEIPPQAVAALFEANGIQTAAGPEAGTAQGSGGNFEVPVGGIGDAFDIGDLLPPTELSFDDRTIEEYFEANAAPRFAMGTLGLGAFSLSLSEEGLASGLRDSNPDGSDFSDSATYTLELGASDPNGDPLKFTFGAPTSPFTANGQEITWEGVGTDHLIGKAGDVTVFDIRISGPSGTVTIQLLAPVDHPIADLEDVVNLGLTVTANDGRGGTATATITVGLEDDSPVIGKPENGIVDEDGLPQGIGDHAPGDDQGGNKGSEHGESTYVGNLHIAWGADDRDAADGLNEDGSFAQDSVGRSVYFSLEDFADFKEANKNLTSGGLPLNFTRSPDGTIITATAGEGEGAHDVFRISLSDDDTGRYKFQLLGQLDHGKGYQGPPGGEEGPGEGGGEIIPVLLRAPAEQASIEDDIDLTFKFTARDADGDTAKGEFTVKIDDDMPTIVENEGHSPVRTVSESDIRTDLALGTSPNDGNADGSHTGSLTDTGAGPAFISGSLQGVVDFGADGFGRFAITDTAESVFADYGITSEGQALDYELGHSGQWATLTATAGEREVFEFRLNTATGEYEFRLFDQLDHLRFDGEATTLLDKLTLDFGAIIRAYDRDGDFVVLNGQLAIDVTDDKPTASGTDNTVAEGLVDGVFHSAAATGQLDFNPGADNGKVTAVSLRTVLDMDAPGGFPALKSNGIAVTSTSSTDDDGVITVTGVAGDKPVYTLTVQPDGSYKFKLLAPVDHPDKGESGDADKLRLVFDFTVTDQDGDATPFNDGYLQIDIKDDAPTAGGTDNVVEEDFVDGVFHSAAATGQLDFNPGADNGKVTAVSLRDVLDMDAPESGRFPVLKSNGVAVASSSSTDDDGVITVTGMAGAKPIYTLTVQPDGSYTFKLLAPVDHPDKGESGDADRLRLVFDFTVTDQDGDATPFNDGYLQIDIKDDAPTASGSGTKTVQEDLVDGVFHADAATGQLVFNPGADNGKVTAVSLRDVLDMDAPEGGRFPELKSNGVAVTSSSSTDVDGVITVTGVAGDKPIYTLTVQPNGSYTFKLLAPVDHPDKGESGDDDKLRLVFDFTVTDQDGDATAFNDGWLQIDILDDAPTADFSGTGTVREDSVNGAFHAEAATGQLVFDPGADNGEVSGVRLRTVLDMNAPEDGHFPELKSGGVVVQSTSQTDAHGVVTVTGKAGEVPVYTLTVQPDGSYTFKLLAAIDHPPAGSDTLRLVFDFVVTDQDGDTTPWKVGALQIDIVDNPNTAPVIVAPDQLGYATSQFLSPLPFENVTYINRLVIADKEQVDTPVTMRLALQYGTLEARSGDGVDVSGSGTKVLTLTGTIAKINAFIAANSVEFDPDNGWPIARLDDKLTVVVNDGAGGIATSVIAIAHSSELRSDWSGWNLNKVGAYYGQGDDTVVTSWSHGPSSSPVVYDGGEKLKYVFFGKDVSDDKITLVFQAQQLAEILTNSHDRQELDGFLTNPEHDLDLSGTSWNAMVKNFEDGRIAIATGPTGHVVYEPSASGLADYRSSGNSTGGDDLLIATNAKTSLSGGNGNDILVGHGGNNVLNGGAGDDLLLGGAGNDTLSGGKGNDILSGGSGRDTFVFEHSGGDNRDTITDYVLGEDEIDLTKLLEGSALTSANLAEHVQVKDTGADAVLQVKTGDHWSDVAILSGHGNPGTAIDIRVDDHDFTIKVI